MKVGDSYESPSGLGFVIKALDKDTVTVEVERLYRDKDGERVIKTNEREVPRDRFATFAQAYVKFDG